MIENETNSDSGPLADLVVIEAGNMISAGSTGRLLADFGATVIKIEHPEMGDPLRELQPRKGEHGLWWKYLSRNKKTITLDMSDERGQTVLKDLVSEADAVIENFRPGTFERWNIGFEELQSVNQDIVMVRISGFGQTGPYAERPGFGTLAEAMSGYASLSGFTDSAPLLPKTGFADNIAALYSAFSLLYALYHRDVSGGSGQCIDVSLIEPLLNIMGPEPLQYDQLEEVPERNGNQSSISAPRNVYQTSDGEWLALSASSQRVALRACDAIERPDLKDDPRFETNDKRVDNADALDEVIQSWIGDHEREEVLARFDEYDVPSAPIYDIADIMADEHYRSREAIISIDDDDLGDARIQGIFPKFSDTRGEVHFLGAEKGEHNDLVFRDWLNYDQELLNELESDNII